MHAYFFDIVTTSQVQHDFQGRKLKGPNDACELAQMMAFDFECRDELWATDVVVRDVVGACLFSVPIRRGLFQ
jgi:hypothetical protein